MKVKKPDGWLTVAEVSQLLGASHTTIRTWAVRGCALAGSVVKLDAECVGVRFFFTGESIERFKADCAAARQAEADAADAKDAKLPSGRQPKLDGVAIGRAALARL